MWGPVIGGCRKLLDRVDVSSLQTEYIPSMSNGVCHISFWLPRAIRFAKALQRPIHMAAAVHKQQVGIAPVPLAL